MSGVGGIGGIGGMGALGVNINVGAISTGGLNGPLGNVNAAAMSAMTGTRMDQLLQLMDGFSSAEILIALMMAGGSGHHKKHHGIDDAALGFLLGLSLANQIGHNGPQLPPPPGIPGAGGAAATGGQLNVTA